MPWDDSVVFWCYLNKLNWIPIFLGIHIGKICESNLIIVFYILFLVYPPLCLGTVMYTHLIRFQRNNRAHDDSLRISGLVLLILVIRFCSSFTLTRFHYLSFSVSSSPSKYIRSKTLPQTQTAHKQMHSRRLVSSKKLKTMLMLILSAL